MTSPEHSPKATISPVSRYPADVSFPATTTTTNTTAMSSMLPTPIDVSGLPRADAPSSPDQLRRPMGMYTPVASPDEGRRVFFPSPTAQQPLAERHLPYQQLPHRNLIGHEHRQGTQYGPAYEPRIHTNSNSNGIQQHHHLSPNHYSPTQLDTSYSPHQYQSHHYGPQCLLPPNSVPSGTQTTHPALPLPTRPLNNDHQHHHDSLSIVNNLAALPCDSASLRNKDSVDNKLPELHYKGHTATPLPKIEVHRQSGSALPLLVGSGAAMSYATHLPPSSDQHHPHIHHPRVDLSPHHQSARPPMADQPWQHHPDNAPRRPDLPVADEMMGMYQPRSSVLNTLRTFDSNVHAAAPNPQPLLSSPEITHSPAGPPSPITGRRQRTNSSPRSPGDSDARGAKRARVEEPSVEVAGDLPPVNGLAPIDLNEDDDAEEAALPAGTKTGSSKSRKTGDKTKKIFQCPGCDLTFTRLSALKQHMLSHTGERPHACTLCGRRFSLASNLRRHNSSRACRVMKFESEKERQTGIAGPSTSVAGPAPSTSPEVAYVHLKPEGSPQSSDTMSSSPHSGPSPPGPSSPLVSVLAPPIDLSTPGPSANSPEAGPSTLAGGVYDSPQVKKRKSPIKKVVRRKRHATNDTRWIPGTLASFANAHLLTSTPPFTFCMYRSRNQSANDSPDTSFEDENEEALEPFTRPTLPLHPVRPSPRVAVRRRSATAGSGSASNSVRRGSRDATNVIAWPTGLSSSSDNSSEHGDDHSSLGNPSSPVAPFEGGRALRLSHPISNHWDAGDSSASDSDDYEERDSYEPCAEYPYHPHYWQDKLPGPGLLRQDELIKSPSVARRWMSFGQA